MKFSKIPTGDSHHPLLTSFSETNGQLLDLFNGWAREQVEHLHNAPPTWSVQEMGQPDTERSITTEHIGDIIGILKGK